MKVKKELLLNLADAIVNDNDRLTPETDRIVRMLMPETFAALTALFYELKETEIK
jgi:hypothetical protein